MPGIDDIAGVIVIVSAMTQFAVADWLIFRQNRDAHDEWVKDGEPTRFFWVNNPWSLSRDLARARVALAWQFRTPQWARYDHALVQALVASRVAACIGIVAWVVLAATILGPVAVGFSKVIPIWIQQLTG